MLYKPSKNLTLVVYEDQNATKCFEIRKSQLKTLVIIMPLTLLLFAVGALLAGVYFKNIVQSLKQKEPALIQQLKSEKQVLQQEKSQLGSENANLLQRLQSKDVMVTPTLPFFHPIPGAQDLTSSKPIITENLKTNIKKEKIGISFNLLNNQQVTQKISGHIFVFLKAGNHLQVYPKEGFSFDKSLTSYHLGESFTVSRFRPVEASFPKPSDVQEAMFKIFIFSRKGDLLYKDELGPIAL